MYRDDHEAALARVRALEVEVGKLEADRDRLRARIEELRRPTQRIVYRDAPTDTPTGSMAMRITVALLVSGTLLVMALAGTSHREQSARPAHVPTCTIESSPTGATVMLVRPVGTGPDPDEVAVPIGTTPMQQPRWSWGLYKPGRLELELPGRAPVPVADACDGIVYQLR